VDVDGLAVDLGAQWIGPQQVRMADLVRRLGLEVVPQHAVGRAVLVDGSRRRTYRGTVPLLGPLQLARTGAALLQVRRLAARTGPVAERGPTALDDRTLAAVLDGPLGTGAARRVVDAALRVIFGAEPAELSAAWAAAYAAAAGGDLLALAAVEGGAQQTRIVGGTQQVAARMAERLDVVLERPVARLLRVDGGVSATAADGTALRAGRVVCAVPVPLVERIAHDPPLPPARVALQQRMPMGATAKVVAVYDRAWWREEGLTGEAVLADGPVQVTFDVSGPDGDPPALLAFVTGAAARRLADAPSGALEAAATTALTRAFGPAAATPSSVTALHWSQERWTARCPVANLVPGAARLAAHLRRPVGRLHWAGTETSTDWTGYMEGAVASGRRAADEVVAVAGA
jgi:monoamine oxidase